MALLNLSSPHAVGHNSTQQVMTTVALATLPGLAALIWFFGIGALLNALLGAGFAIAFEALALQLRGRPLAFYLNDRSALVTGLLLGLALPPYCPWWLPLVGAGFAIVIAKQLYGGLGYNPFNPAMAAYVLLLISFPVPMTQWAAPAASLGADQFTPSLAQALGQVFGVAPLAPDGYTAATPLDSFKQASGLMAAQIYAQTPVFAKGQWAGAGFEWVNIGFLLGGLVLLQQRIFSWHAPAAMLASLALMAALFFDGGSSDSGGAPLMHLLSGGTMLGAFFILTDPVTSASSARGKLVFGTLAGVLVYVIRAWGNYPDAVAFAVLLMNFAAPTIDYYTLPRTYGHEKVRIATEKEPQP